MNNITKKFIPCIYVYRSNAVRNMKDTSVVDTDPVRLAKYYSSNNADELIVFMMPDQIEGELPVGEGYTTEEGFSVEEGYTIEEGFPVEEGYMIDENDMKKVSFNEGEEYSVKNEGYNGDHRGVLSKGTEDEYSIESEALDILREICAAIDVSVIGAGCINRLEDVKKILYAGCDKVILDFENPSNIAIATEAALRFGSEKLMISYNDPAILAERGELVEKSASSLLLMNPHQIRESQRVISLPFIVQINNIALNKLIQVFSYEQVAGVTGNTINDNVKSIITLKELCREHGIMVEEFESAYKWPDFKKNSEGLVPVVVQDHKTREVLMVAYMNEEAFEQTLKTGKMTYYSRSRQELWLKGSTSSHFQYVKSLSADCDMDTILAKVSQVGAACHTGSKSCFFHEIVKRGQEESTNPLKVFEEVFTVINDRKMNPKEGSYTNYLFDKGIDKILKKLGEEATEIIIASKNPNSNEIKYEISDFLYHMMVLMAEKDIGWEDITTELANR